MNWRAIMRGEARDLYEQNPQNPQNSGENPNIANFANIADRKSELLRQVRAACTGLSITPDQFMVLLNDQDKAAILDGEIPVVPTLRAYAESFSKGIQSGRIKFHPTSGALLKHL